MKECPICNKKVNEVAKQCPYCDYDFINEVLPTYDFESNDTPVISNSIDSNNIINSKFPIKETSYIVFDLDMEIIKALRNIGLFLDSNNVKEYCPLTSYLKVNSENSIVGIFLDDLFKYLGYLGLVDGTLMSKEVELINYIFNTHWTKKELLGFLDTALENYPPNSLPLTFMILHEYDLFVQSKGEPRIIKLGLNLVKEYDSIMLSKGEIPTAFKMCELLYEELGHYAISTDGFKEDEEFRAQLDFILKLRRDYEKFKVSEYEKILRTLDFNSDETVDETLKSGTENFELPADVDPMEKIKEAKELLDIGAITQEEFDVIKNKYMKFI